MTVEEKQRVFKHVRERWRSGMDTGSEMEKRRIGERRSGIDRRLGSVRRSSTAGRRPKQS